MASIAGYAVDGMWCLQSALGRDDIVPLPTEVEDEDIGPENADEKVASNLVGHPVPNDRGK